MHKAKSNIAPVLFSELFSFSSIPIGSDTRFQQPSVNTVWNGLETVTFLGPKI